QGAGVPLGSAWKSRLASPAEPAGCGMAPCPRTHPTYSRPATAQNGCLSAWIRATGPSWAQPDCRPLGPAGPLAALTDIEAALRARAFLRMNADLLVLTERDFPSLEWTVSQGSRIVEDRIGWTVSAKRRDAVPPPPLPALARHVWLVVAFGRHGGVE